MPIGGAILALLIAWHNGAMLASGAMVALSLTALGLLAAAAASRARGLRIVGEALTAVGAGDLSVALPPNLPAELSPLIAGYGSLTEALRQRQQALDLQLRRTALLTRLSIELREALEPATIVERVLRGACVTLGLDEATCILTNSTGATVAAYRWHDGDVQPLECRRADHLLACGLEGWALRVGSPGVFADVSVSERWRAVGGHPSGSAMVLPISQAATTLGVLTVYSSRSGAFGNRDLLMMEGVVAQAGVALVAAQRYQEERQRGRQALALLTMSQMLTVEGTREELAASLDEVSRSVLHVERGLLYLLGPNGEPALIAPQGARPHGESEPAVRAAAGEAAGRACAEARIVTVEGDAGCGNATYFALPLVQAGRTIGACVYMQQTGGTAALTPSLWSLLTMLSNIMASACANSALVEQLRQHAGQLERLVERRTEELRRSRDLLRIIFDNLAEGLILLDSDGSLLAANNTFCRGIAGCIPREVVGRTYRQLWDEIAARNQLRLDPQGPGEHGAPLLPAPGEAFHRRPAAWRLCGTDLTGQQRWYSVERIPVVGLDGELGRYLERWRDITHQEELQRRMLLHEQLTSLGRLAASVVHEVGNPLQSVQGCLELCREDRGLSERSAEYLGLALSELERMGRTIDSLRNLYRPPQLSWVQVDLNQLLVEVARVTQRQLHQAQVRLELELDQHLPAIVGQPDALRQVFLNLALNAQQAMPGGGVIRVRTGRREPERLAEVTVCDTGVGMRPEQLAQLFEPFRSGKAQGVGLGLYLSKQLIEQHAGRIEVKSDVGRGTTMAVLLPLQGAESRGETKRMERER